jgi:ribonuclease III
MSNNANDKKKRYRQLNACEKVLKVKFKNKSLLNKALTHRSLVNESRSDVKDNERLENLGDSVLGFIVSDYLYKHFPSIPEGSLSKIKSVVVSDHNLAKVSLKLNLGSFILMGKGEENSGGRQRSSILANTLEAIIGAIYLDNGLKVAKKFLLPLLKDKIEKTNNFSTLLDPKTAFQEYIQKKYKKSPKYEVIIETGPAHDREFTVKLIVENIEVSKGKGHSKRKAEMSAAKIALQQIEDGVIKV